MTNFNNYGVGRYIDLMFDRGFKRVFGKEANKDVLIAFLNQVIPDKVIADLKFINIENEGLASDSKKSFFDVQCTIDDGSTIIVEVQRSNQPYFKERVLYYASLPILRQLEAGADYKMVPVYVVSILSFQLEHRDWDEGRIESHYSIREDFCGEQMTNALHFIFIELGRFRKTVGNLENDKEKWYFCLLNMGSFLERPREMQAEVFRRLFDVAEVEALPGNEREQYIKDMTTERDIINQKEFARQEGRAEGLAEGKAEGLAEGEAKGLAKGLAEAKAEIAKGMLENGIDLKLIVKLTGLSEEEVKSL